MDTFVVRVYRREPRADRARRNHDRAALTGIVENTATGTQTTFHEPGQLWAVLASALPASGPVAANGNAKRRKR